MDLCLSHNLGNSLQNVLSVEQSDSKTVAADIAVGGCSLVVAEGLAVSAAVECFVAESVVGKVDLILLQVSILSYLLAFLPERPALEDLTPLFQRLVRQ